MKTKTTCFIFGKDVTEDHLKKANSFFENHPFTFFNRKISNKEKFVDLGEEKIDSIIKELKDCYVLWSWFSEEDGFGYALHGKDGFHVEMIFSPETKIEKTEFEFISFFGLSAEWEEKSNEIVQ
jgi:hypothetical protein